MSKQNLSWTPQRWRQLPIQQDVTYPNPCALAAVERELRTQLPLVSLPEILDLEQDLSATATGESLLLQGGDCAGSFEDSSVESVEATLSTLLQMSIILAFGIGRPVVKIGRIAGQYAKPRSSATEIVNGESLTSYYGDMINDWRPIKEARSPDPARLMRAYSRSAATANLLRMLSRSYSREHLHRQISTFLSQLPGGEEFGHHFDMALRSASAPSEGRSTRPGPVVYFSHEALSLRYEEALIRRDEPSRQWFSGSAHMLWIGERTRGVEGAHVEFASGIANPVGIKCGPNLNGDDLLRLIDRINPSNRAGRLILIIRMGADHIGNSLPHLIRHVAREGRVVTWISDPMHGNTTVSPNGFKTRDFDRIFKEAATFFDIHDAEGSLAGGLHVEVTGQAVTECTGGTAAISYERLPEFYLTRCDPRLSNHQALELAFLIAQARMNRNSGTVCSPSPKGTFARRKPLRHLILNHLVRSSSSRPLLSSQSEPERGLDA